MNREPVQVYQWQYNGVAPFYEIIEWCEDHLGCEFHWDWETIYFADQGQYAWFILRWT